MANKLIENTYLVKYRNVKGHTIRKYISAITEESAMNKFYYRFGKKHILSCTMYIC